MGKIKNDVYRVELEAKRRHNQLRSVIRHPTNLNKMNVPGFEDANQLRIDEAKKNLDFIIDLLRETSPNSPLLDLLSNPDLGFLQFESFKLERGDYTSETHNITFEFVPSSPVGVPDKEIKINSCDLSRIIIYSEADIKSFLANEIHRVVELDEEKTRSFLGIAGKATVGLAAGLIFAPLGIIGAAAGAMSKKRNIRVIIFGIEFNSGEKIVCSVEAQKEEFIQFKSVMNKLSAYESLAF